MDDRLDIGDRERAEVVWTPASDAFSASRMGHFAASVGTSDYPSLLAWSIARPGEFWHAIGEWADVRWHDRAETVLADPAMPGAWFPGATLNYAEHALRAPGSIISLSQSRDRVEVTSTDLADAVSRCRAGLVRLGVGRGDRVAAYLPNIHETIVAFLATASLGAIWSSCAPEFGVRAVVDRWSQLEPKVMLTVDGYRYGRRPIERRAEIAEIVAALASLDHVVLVAYLDPSIEPDDLALPAACLSWAELCDGSATPFEFEPVPFDHPLYVLFSSGTTGLPKPIVHGHGGITLEHIKVLALHHDLGPNDRFMWFTTTGWMMWNFLVSGLLVGATVVLFDGDPAFPDLSTLWRVAADEQVDVFGVSAPFIMASRKSGLEPGRDLDLSRLRQLGSTGAPLPADGFRWIRDAVGRSVQPCSISGGTDVCTAFVGSVPSVAVRAGEISARLLGCDVRAVDPQGADCPPGVTGELVIATPMPSMPVGLWGDPTGQRYRATYFETFPGMWHHGDWITFQPDGACEITGRSDATLNRGGVRLGTSDFYSVVEALPEVADSVIVHLEDPDGGPGTLILLVSGSEPGAVDDGVRQRIAATLRSQLSPRHVPDVVAEVRAIPRTLSGKKLEVPIKRMLQGEPAERVASRGSLADPTALDEVALWCETFRLGESHRGS